MRIFSAIRIAPSKKRQVSKKTLASKEATRLQRASLQKTARSSRAMAMATVTDAMHRYSQQR
jgi:hypothetical protein